ncbi:hypothetical protein K488DRAFT_74654 [Vararia minispora EC-137]|uniref:Uncharacterized protein n=1 Tax=Vararia minispora EC-137 TaxID=1314806 RepID=A0ACB8Q6E8_9AGAM|nr:hypothetical protein K488DRAFT_74654 [Vararia minispora EC-137]
MSSRFYTKKNPRTPSKANPGSTANPSRTPPTEPSNGAAKLQCRGCPLSIKSKVHRDWLEDHRLVYEHAVQKGRKATSDFLSSTTTAFLDKFGWTNTHFVSYNSEEQDRSHKGTGAAAQEDKVQMAAIYKLARQPGSTKHAMQGNSAELLLQSLLNQAKPVHRPKLVNIFHRSAHYTPEMRTECIRRWKEASGVEHRSRSYEAEYGDDMSLDSDGCNGDDKSADSSGKDASRDGRTAGKCRQRQCLVEEEKFLLEQLEASSAKVIADIEQRAHLKYQEKIGQRQAWLSEGPKTFEEAAAYVPGDISVYSFLGGLSPPPDGNVDMPGLRLDQYDTEGHGDICKHIQEYGMRGLFCVTQKFHAPSPKGKTSTSDTPSSGMRLAEEGELDDLLEHRDTTPSGSDEERPNVMGWQGLVFLESEEGEGPEADSYWPGEVSSIDPSAGDSDTSYTFQQSGAEASTSNVFRMTTTGYARAQSGTSDDNSTGEGMQVGYRSTSEGVPASMSNKDRIAADTDACMALERACDRCKASLPGSSLQAPSGGGEILATAWGEDRNVHVQAQAAGMLAEDGAWRGSGTHLLPTLAMGTVLGWRVWPKIQASVAEDADARTGAGTGLGVDMDAGVSERLGTIVGQGPGVGGPKIGCGARQKC